MRTLVGLAVGLLACGNPGGSGAAFDMAHPADLTKTPDLALLSVCGHPGDKGNSLGVGKYCKTIDDCDNQMASLCTAIANGSTPNALDTYFCSFFCKLGGGTSQCGENATCACNKMNQCACTPNSCFPK